jgi:hypothetical protein
LRVGFAVAESAATYPSTPPDPPRVRRPKRNTIKLGGGETQWHRNQAEDTIVRRAEIANRTCLEHFPADLNRKGIPKALEF